MNEATLLKIIKASKITTLVATGVDAIGNFYIRASKFVDQENLNAKLDAKNAELEARVNSLQG